MTKHASREKRVLYDIEAERFQRAEESGKAAHLIKEKRLLGSPADHSMSKMITFFLSRSVK